VAGDRLAAAETIIRPPSVAGARRRRRIPWLPWVLPIALLGLWQASVAFHWVEAYQLTPPLQVVESAVDMWNRGLLQTDISSTVFRVLAGFAIGSTVALFLGTITGLSRRAHEAVEPTLQAIRSVPTLAWGPLLLLWLGIDDLPKVVLVAIGAFFPVYVNLVSGIMNVDRKLIEVARIYNLTWPQTARRVILPATLPNLFTGLRLGFSQAWLFVVVAEIFGATKGLGFRLTDSQLLTRVDLMLVAMLTLAVLGKITDMIILAIQRRALRWRDTLDTEAGR
jgi:sulfonate transport system permease protein